MNSQGTRRRATLDDFQDLRAALVKLNENASRNFSENARCGDIPRARGFLASVEPAVRGAVDAFNRGRPRGMDEVTFEVDKRTVYPFRRRYLRGKLIDVTRTVEHRKVLLLQSDKIIFTFDFRVTTAVSVEDVHMSIWDKLLGFCQPN